MIAGKQITRIAALLMAATVFLCLGAMAFAENIVEAVGGPGIALEYESRLFDTEEILRVNIVMEETDWEDMLANAMAENYYACDVEINGEMFYRVGIRPKGNTSLSAIASDPDTDRYSLKLEFDQYVEGQTCYGLDKLILNNNYADATSMKEALVYDMYRYLGADASLSNYAEISVNGQYQGLYLALEAVEDSFLLQNYGTENGKLYKPEGMDMGNGGGGGGFSMGGNGANLNYIDEDLDSYTAIWEGEVTDTSDGDHRRVVKALKHISEGAELETYMDVDNLLKYMAVHVFSVNEDSLSGMMAHNYYLYESGGQLNILPWDYNLAFGGMGGMGGRDGGNGGSATSMVNDAIDYAFSATEFFDALMENEEYHEKYFDYLSQLVEEYVSGGSFDRFYQQTRGQIDPLVESDPTAFYTYAEYEEAADTLYQAVQLRAQSISGQLAGTIPSTEEEQRGSEALVDASHLELGVMGSMHTGDRMRDWNGEEDEAAPGAVPETTLETAVDGPARGGERFVEAMARPMNGGRALRDTDTSGSEGEMPGGAQQPGEDGVEMPGDGQQPPEEGIGEMPGGVQRPGEDGVEMPGDGQWPPEEGMGGMPGDGQQPPGNGMGAMPGMDGGGGGNGETIRDNLLLYGACFIVLTAALAFANLYRRRPRRRT